MPGKILNVKAGVGTAVKKGDVILILEAMKMENDVVAPEDGTVAAPVAAPKAAPKAASKAAPKAAAGAGSIKVEAGAAGKVFKIEASVGQKVSRGDAVLIVEAMKMEIPVVAPEDGTVASINVSAGDAVEAGDVLATLN